MLLTVVSSYYQTPPERLHWSLTTPRALWASTSHHTQPSKEQLVSKIVSNLQL